MLDPQGMAIHLLMMRNVLTVCSIGYLIVINMLIGIVIIHMHILNTMMLFTNTMITVEIIITFIMMGKVEATFFGIGAREYPHCNPGSTGTDKINSNSNEVWTSRELQGDRWDAWKVNYNEVFSPYSSPSTVDYFNNPTGVFIFLDSQNGNTANFKIYKATAETSEEETVLMLTPPSRPMGLTISLSECVNGVRHPKITWNHNREPDMKRSNETKIYNILKAVSPNSTEIPVNYFVLGSLSINENETPQYTDCYTDIDCNDESQINQFVRYEIEAIDKYDSISVPSDFVSTSALRTRYGDRLINPNNNILISYSLSQNYPNPFNPVTTIKYSIPKEGFITIKIFDLIGKEIYSANEYRLPGRYEMSFNGSNYASGVYLYRLETKDFIDVKKMVLIK